MLLFWGRCRLDKQMHTRASRHQGRYYLRIAQLSTGKGDDYRRFFRSWLRKHGRRANRSLYNCIFRSPINLLSGRDTKLSETTIQRLLRGCVLHLAEVATQLSVRDNMARDLDIKLTRLQNYKRVRPDARDTLARRLLRFQHDRSNGLSSNNIFTFLQMRCDHLYRKEERAERRRI